MKTAWNDPELLELGVQGTERGTKPSITRDECHWDDDGNWWGGGRS